MKSNAKSKIIILITLGILFALLPIITSNLSYITGNSDKSSDYGDVINLDKENLKISAVSERIHIDNNWTAAKAAGICTGNGTYSEPYVIEDLVIDGGGSGSCIFINNSDKYFKIENCTAYNSGGSDSGIRLYNVTKGKLVANNFTYNHYGIYLYGNNNTISGNTASNNTLTGIYLRYSEDNTISGNLIQDNNLYGILLHYSDDNTISGNIANNNTGGTSSSGISLQYSNNNAISGNNASYNARDGIYLIHSDDNDISGNTANNNTRDGILLIYSNDNDISGNIVNNNGEDGIEVRQTYGNTITGNTANNSTRFGINLDYSNHNDISGNTVNNNYESGISLSGDYNTILGNIITFNGNGIELSSSSNDNIIYFNNFINNNRNILSIGSSDIWNSPVKIIYSYMGDNYTNYLGNYWDNYTGIDENNDGIGDTPFIIDGVIDYYPLMEPIENYEIIEMLEPSEISGGGIPIEMIVVISVISGGAVIGVATILLIRRKRKRIE